MSVCEAFLLPLTDYLVNANRSSLYDAEDAMFCLGQRLLHTFVTMINATSPFAFVSINADVSYAFIRWHGFMQSS